MEDSNYVSEIHVNKYEWKTDLILKGHYEFEIVFKIMRSKGICKASVFRRFSDIEWLHQGLLEYNPGCLIPKLPEKNFWANIYVDTSEFLNKRMKEIDVYLSYINNHKYLKKNPRYIAFLSEEFEKIKIETQKATTMTLIYDKLKKYIPNFLKNKEAKLFLPEQGALDKEKDNIMRLDKGLSLINQTIVNIFLNQQNNIKIHSERAELIKNMANIAKNLEGTSLSLDQSKDEKLQKNQTKNIEILNNIFEKQYNYSELLRINIEEQLKVKSILKKKYSEDVSGLKEIFERREKLIQKINALQQGVESGAEKREILEKEISEHNSLLKSADVHLLDEIQSFKNNREKDLLLLFKKFFKNKYESTEEIAKIFDGQKEGFK